MLSLVIDRLSIQTSAFVLAKRKGMRYIYISILHLNHSLSVASIFFSYLENLVLQSSSETNKQNKTGIFQCLSLPLQEQGECGQVAWKAISSACPLSAPLFPGAAGGIIN